MLSHVEIKSYNTQETIEAYTSSSHTLVGSEHIYISTGDGRRVVSETVQG